MDILGLIITLVMIVVLIAGISKRVSPATVLLIASLIGLVYYTIVSGSILGENTVGNKWLDIFEYISTVFMGQLTSNIMILGSLMGYVAYCEKVNATTCLCLTLAKPLLRFKKHPMIVVVCIMIFEALMKFVVMSNNAQVALIFATLFPVMIALGVTKETAAAAMAFACYITWGPANGFTSMYSGMGEFGMSVAEYFVRYDMPNIIVSFGLALVAFVFSNKYFDKKDGCIPSPSPIENIDFGSLGCPRWYAIWPLLPIVLVLVFSKLVVKTIVITVPGAALLCWILLFIVESIRKKDKKAVFSESLDFWKGFGNVIWTVGCLIVTATLFSNVLTKIGALASLFSMVGNSNAGFSATLIIVSLAAGALSILNGNMSGAVPLFGAIMAGVCDTLGVNFTVAVRTLMPVTCTATAVSPVSNSSLYCASITKVDIMTIVKRVIAPTVVFIISTFIVTMVIMK